MKKVVNLFILSALLLLLGTVASSAQESYLPDKGNELNRAVITVRGNELSSRVVILDIVRTGKAYELHCNQGASGCAALKNGKYQIVELPKNSVCTIARTSKFIPRSLSTRSGTESLASTV